VIKTISWILLLVHVCTSLFIPVVEEKDVYDVCGRQIDDINTIFEYVDQIILGNIDVTPEDEDDDQPHYFTGSSSISYYITAQEQTIPVINEPTTTELAVAYPLLPVQKTSSVAYDILTPPPEA
jgi:hypothetical protein